MHATQLLAWVRKVGRFDWLGSDIHAVLMDSGALIGPECVRPNYRHISFATRHNSERNDWCAVAIAVLDGSEPYSCAHCGGALT